MGMIIRYTKYSDYNFVIVIIPCEEKKMKRERYKEKLCNAHTNTPITANKRLQTAQSNLNANFVG